MTLWFMDGFDHMTGHTAGPSAPANKNTGAEFARKWTGGTTTWGDPTIANGHSLDPVFARHLPGQGLAIAGTSAKPYKTRPLAAVDTLILGAAVFFEALVPGTGSIMGLYDGVTEQVSLRGNAAGNLTFTRNGTVLATSVNTVSINTWYFIEIKCKVNNTTGTYEVRVNGSSTGWIPPATGANTRNTANNQATGIFIGSHTSSRLTWFDDLYSLDTLGSVNNDFIGPQMISTIRPAQNGNYAQFTSNFGKHSANVGATYPDGDQSFNHTATPDSIDTFVMNHAAISSGTIAGVQHVLYAKQDAGAARVIAPVQRSGSTDYVGTNKNLSTSYQVLLDVAEVDPATAAPYTISNLAAAEFGYKLVS